MRLRPGSRPSPPQPTRPSRCDYRHTFTRAGKLQECLCKLFDGGESLLSLCTRNLSWSIRCWQVRVGQAAVSHMLVNSESLRGIAPRVRALAAREAAVSAVVPPQVLELSRPESLLSF